MATFLIEYVRFLAITLALAAPLFIIAHRRDARKTARRFLTTATIISLFLALDAVLSDRLVRDCEAGGNTACYDFGGAGYQIMLIVGFTAVAWFRAFLLYED